MKRIVILNNGKKDELINNLVNDLAICPKDIQDKMLALAQQADEEYGRHLSEGLAAKGNTSNHEEFGEDFHPLGANEAAQGVQDAVDKGHDANPY